VAESPAANRSKAAIGTSASQGNGANRETRERIRAERALRRAGVPGSRAAGAPERLLITGAGALMAAIGVSRRSLPGAALAVAGGAMAYRAAVGDERLDRLFDFSATVGGSPAIAVERSVRIARPAGELFAFLRDPANHSRLVKGGASVEAREGRSRWTADAPGGRRITWEVEIVEEREPQLLGWRSVRGGGLDLTGRVELRPAPHDETEVRLAADISQPPGPGGVRPLAALATGEIANRVATELLRHFKQLMETGEIATVAGQPAGTRSRLGRTVSGTRAGRDRR
jgi:uncharacterized membrane protein